MKSYNSGVTALESNLLVTTRELKRLSGMSGEPPVVSELNVVIKRKRDTETTLLSDDK